MYPPIFVDYDKFDWILVHDQVNDCNKCAGGGRIIPSKAVLLRSINLHLAELLINAEWVKRHYDNYMDAVDTQHRHASNARRRARQLLDLIHNRSNAFD